MSTGPSPAAASAVPSSPARTALAQRPPGAAPQWLLPTLAATVVAALAAADVWLAILHADRRHAAHRAAGPGSAVVLGESPVVTAAQRAAIAAARRRIPALLSYDYRQLDAFLRDAPANVTGPFKDVFARRMQTVVGPAAVKNQVSTRAEIKTVGVVAAHTDQVQLLVFVDQTVTSRTSRNGRVDGARMKVTMARAGGTWLVADLTAV